MEDLEVLHTDFKDACVFAFTSIDDAEVAPQQPWENVANYVEVETTVNTALMPMAESAGSVEEFLSTLPIFRSTVIQDIEKRTRGQSANVNWFIERQGRVTGSVVHSVLTRSRKLTSGEEIDNSLLLKRLLYSKPNMEIPAMKYGREMEEEAREKYISIMKSGGHDLQVKDCGLFVDSEDVFLAANPDGLIACASCCGQGVLEIKCPLSVSHCSPSTGNLSYIEEVGDTFALKQSHQYYSQVIFKWE